MDTWLGPCLLDEVAGTNWGWILLVAVLFCSGVLRLAHSLWRHFLHIQSGLLELHRVCEDLGGRMDAWNNAHSEHFRHLEQNILALLQDHRRAVVCEPQSFLQPLLLENWDRTRQDVLQQIRLLGLELQDLRGTMSDLIKVQALIRKSLIPVTTDTPGDIREINGHLSMIREGIEMDTQGLMGAVQGMEERLQRIRQEVRSHTTLHPQFQSDVMMHLSVIRAHLSAGAQPDTNTVPGPPPPWA
ncbi:TTN [Symbiodinium sp. CCMP2592]|nr:TTN [Symbiodinium sp. CCMP2592]